MKRRLYALGLSLLGIPLACVTSSDTPQPKGDAGTPVYDASLPDAPPADAATPPDAPDASPGEDASVDAPPPVVTVRVQRGGQPENAIPVIFHDAAGAVVEAVATGADGSVAREVAEGAQVSVLLMRTGGRQIVTFVGVKNGDVLTVPDDDPSSGGSGVSARVTIPTPVPNDAVDFTVRAGTCSNWASIEASTADLDVSSICMGPAGAFPLLLEAANESGAPIAYAYKKGNSPAGDAGVDDAGALLVDGVSPWSTTYGSDTIQVLGAATRLWVHYGEVADGLSYTRMEYVPPSPNGASEVFPAHRGYAEAVQTQLSAFDGPTMTSIASRQDAPSQDTTFTIDPSLLLPAVTDVSVDTGSGRATFTWTSESPLSAADGALLVASWSNPVDGGSSEHVEWLVIAPPTATSVVVPQFPASASAWGPAPDAQPYVRYLAIVETDRVASYDALRQIVYAGGYTALDPYAMSPWGTLPPLATNGTLRATLWGIPLD